MGTISLAVQLFIVFLLTSYLLNKYSTIRKQNLIVTISTFIGWYFSLIIIFVLPLDVAITFYHKCSNDRQRVLNISSTPSPILPECELPGGYVPDEVLFDLWRVVYWSAQILTWLILPLLQSYVTAGNFTIFGKIRAAVINNTLYYGIYSLCFLAILIYAMLKGVSINIFRENLKVIVVSASNTWGLFLLVVLLGHGLVELPRSLWHHGNRHYRLRKTYFDIEKLASEKSEAEENVKEIYKKVRILFNSMKSDSNGQRRKVRTILSKFSDNVIDQLFPSRQTLNNASAQWKVLVDRALFLENLAFSESNGYNLDLSRNTCVPTGVRRIWYTRLQTPLCRVLGVVTIFMTIFVLLSECTFFVVSYTVSPAAFVTEYASNRFHYKYTQFVAFGIIVYLITCAYFTIFRLQIYKYYHLDPNGHTDENSILFSAILLCRLTPPICLNFLGMIHMDSHVSMAKSFGVETQFTKLMGHLDVLPILATGINIYLPICIILLCAIHYYRVGAYVLHNIGFDQFVESDEMTNDMINSGRSLVQIERNSIKRSNERNQRNENWTKSIGNTANTNPVQKYKRSRKNEEERPMLEEEEMEERELTESPRISMSPSGHPSSSGFFDDM
uniref:LMBR1 domain-containing protein 2 n=1 Tax=Caenorhabditis tropicalis TaxID=1561998 RepID=A0A1I7T0P3_9PELO